MEKRKKNYPSYMKKKNSRELYKLTAILEGRYRKHTDYLVKRMKVSSKDEMIKILIDNKLHGKL